MNTDQEFHGVLKVRDFEGIKRIIDGSIRDGHQGEIKEVISDEMANLYYAGIHNRLNREDMDFMLKVEEYFESLCETKQLDSLIGKDFGDQDNLGF